MERIIAKNKKMAGFSMLEMIVAVFIFSLIISLTVSVFIAAYKNQKDVRELQQNSEDIRVAMELMAKNIRMGTIDSVNEKDNSIAFYNYSQEKCMKYFIEGERIKAREKSGSRVDMENCGSVDYSSISELVADSIVENLVFDIQRSNYDGDHPVVGKVTISVELKNYPNEPVQTTVSLRDYAE